MTLSKLIDNSIDCNSNNLIKTLEILNLTMMQKIIKQKSFQIIFVQIQMKLYQINLYKIHKSKKKNKNNNKINDLLIHLLLRVMKKIKKMWIKMRKIRKKKVKEKTIMIRKYRMKRIAIPLLQHKIYIKIIILKFKSISNK